MSTLLRSPVLWFIVYVGVVLAVVFGMLHARRRAREVYAGAGALEEWETWRSEARKQAEGEGPVARRIPKSAEPPALVLMRDYFVGCLIGSLLLSSALFASMMFLIRGVLSGESKIDYDDDSDEAT